MRKIINGKAYDTDTAEHLCDLPCAYHRGDFYWHETGLYRTAKGAFFVAGEGGALSMWQESLGRGEWGGGDGLRPVTDAEALSYLEEAGETKTIERLFAVEEA